VVVGVSKARPHRVTGTRWTQDDEERIQDAARATQPPLTAHSASVAIDGESVVFIAVDPVSDGWVHTSDGRLLVRAGPPIERW